MALWGGTARISLCFSVEMARSLRGRLSMCKLTTCMRIRYLVTWWRELNCSS